MAGETFSFSITVKGKPKDRKTCIWPIRVVPELDARLRYISLEWGLPVDGSACEAELKKHIGAPRDAILLTPAEFKWMESLGREITGPLATAEEAAFAFLTRSAKDLSGLN